MSQSIQKKHWHPRTCQKNKNVDIVSMTLLILKPSPKKINKSFHSLPLRMKSQLLSSVSRTCYTIVLCTPWALTLKSPLLTCWFSCSSLLLRSNSQFRLLTLLFSFPVIYLFYWAEKSTNQLASLNWIPTSLPGLSRWFWTSMTSLPDIPLITASWYMS